jgi:hypothetical protein
MLSSLQDCPRVSAFWSATPLTLGVEALPIEHRPVMHHVLLAAGFTGEDDWLSMKGLPHILSLIQAQTLHFLFHKYTQTQSIAEGFLALHSIFRTSSHRFLCYGVRKEEKRIASRAQQITHD